MDLKIITIYDIFKLQLGTFTYESINNIGPSSNIIRYTRTNEIHSYNTQYAHTETFFQNYGRTTIYGLKGLQIEGTHLWNPPLI